ncbi:imm11 family protein [Leptospira ainazelensis]|uniref:imm11 family protein n=1 Tax=Leptospira ainazelensis TaxID=2810034 RepID=UPI001E31E099|nr:DUF1629 domain-containing protein [Leptospira ainazelensis]
MVFILEYKSFSDKEANSLPRPTIQDRGNLNFDEGIPVPDPPESIDFRMNFRNRVELGDLVLTGLPGLVISGKFKNSLDSAGIKNIEYIPARIFDSHLKKNFEDYFVANIIGLVDCIDFQRSKLTMRAAFPDKIRNIEELYIDESKLNDLPIFRLKRRITLVLISESLKQILESSKLQGIEIIPANGYST